MKYLLFFCLFPLGDKNSLSARWAKLCNLLLSLLLKFSILLVILGMLFFFSKQSFFFIYVNTKTKSQQTRLTHFFLLVTKFKNLPSLLNYVFAPNKRMFLVLCFPYLKCITKVAMVRKK